MKARFRLPAAILAAILLCGSVTACRKAPSDPSADSADTSDAATVHTIPHDWPLADKEQDYGAVFGQGEVIDIQITMTDEDWTDICENPVAEEYHPATITVNGVTLEDVGFRTKGFSSLSTVANSDSDRYGFKVKTNEYVKGQTLCGLDKFVLNGSFADASYMREYLTYLASDALGLMTPHVAYANLYINGEHHGFYLLIEAYDEGFVERYTDDPEAVLYKAESESCTLLPSDDGQGFDVDYGTDEGNTHIQALVEALNATDGDTAALEAVLDVDSVLKSVAVNTVMGNYDSYCGSKAHNYYLLWQNGKFSYIGWDYNMSIGGFSEDNGSSATVDISTPVYNTTLDSRPLVGKLLAVDAYYQRYIGYVEALTAYFADFEGIVNGIAEVISPYVENDPTAFYTYEQYQSSITASAGGSMGDLSDMNGGDMGQLPGGQMPDMGDGSLPEGGMIPGGDMTLPEGETMPEGMVPGMDGGMNPGGQMPDMGDGSLPEGGMMPGGDMTFPGGEMTLPEGETMPEGGEIPTMPEGGQVPTMPDGSQMPGMDQLPNMGGDMMMSTVGVSIVDYMTQRLAHIRGQLESLS